MKVRMWDLSERLKKLPPYLFAEIDRKKAELKRKGIKFVDLSVGDPDIDAPVGPRKLVFKPLKC